MADQSYFENPGGLFISCEGALRFYNVFWRSASLVCLPVLMLYQHFSGNAGKHSLDTRKLQSFGANTAPFPVRAKRSTGRNKREPPPVLGLFLAQVKQVPITRPSEAFCQWCLRNMHSAHGLSNMHSAFGAAQGADGNALRAIETPPR